MNLICPDCERVCQALYSSVLIDGSWNPSAVITCKCGLRTERPILETPALDPGPGRYLAHDDPQ